MVDLGAIGHPDVKPGILEKGILLRLRFELDQYINLRPVRLYPGVETPLKNKGPEQIDYAVIRENSGGIYTGTGGISMKDTPNEVAVQSMSTIASKWSAACAMPLSIPVNSAEKPAARAMPTPWDW